MWPFNRSNRKVWIGAEFTEKAAALVAVDVSTEKPLVKACDYFECDESEHLYTLSQWVNANGLQRAKLNRVLHSGQYELIAMEAPKVEPEELKGAVRWKLKDMISDDIDDVAVDIFSLPSDAYSGRMEMLYAVVAQATLVQDSKRLETKSNTHLKTVDISELSMMNLVKLSSIDTSNEYGLLKLDGDHSVINLCHNDNVYMSREIDAGVIEAPMTNEAISNLGLEIQRSLDFFETQIGKNGTNNIVLFPLADPELEKEVVTSLHEKLSVKFHRINLLDIVDLDEGVEMSSLFQCCTALSSALRYQAIQG